MSMTPSTPHSWPPSPPTSTLSVLIPPGSVSCTLANTAIASPEAGSGDSFDPLHREFMESALGALQRQCPTQSSRTSLDIQPLASPNLPTKTMSPMLPRSLLDGTWENARRGLSSDPLKPNVFIENDANVGQRGPPAYHSPLQTRSQSPFSSTQTCVAEEDFYSGCKSPTPIDDRTLDMRNERMYRELSQHEFSPSLILPLFSPCLVGLGAVGYHRKPEGDFITLFNALSSHEALEGEYNISSLYGYGLVTRECQPLTKRSMPQRAIDAIQSSIGGCFHNGSQPHVIRRHSTQLRSGHKKAHLVTESTVYEYIEDLAVPKAWFTANIDLILKLYGKSHGLQKEDVLLVVGTLEASNYALFVSDDHPDAQLDFSVFSSPRPSQPWGQFSTSKASFLGSSRSPVHDECVPKSAAPGKVSVVQKNRKKADVVLLARLQFQPDNEGPTSR